MAGPIYLSQSANVIASNSPTFTASDGTATGSSTANVANGDPAERWVSGADFTTSPQTLEADFGTNTTADFCAIFNHTFQSSGTLKIQKWNGASYDDAATFTVNDDTYSKNIYVTFTSANPTKWRLHMTAGGDTSIVPTIGEWVLGARTQITRQFITPYTIGQVPNVIRHETAGGSPRTHKISNVRRSFNCQWEDLTDAQALELSTLWILGPHLGQPFAFVPYPDESGETSMVSGTNTDAEVYFVEAPPADLVITNKSPNVNDASMSVVEFPTGLTL